MWTLQIFTGSALRMEIAESSSFSCSLWWLLSDDDASSSDCRSWRIKYATITIPFRCTAVLLKIELAVYQRARSCITYEWTEDSYIVRKCHPFRGRKAFEFGTHVYLPYSSHFLATLNDKIEKFYLHYLVLEVPGVILTRGMPDLDDPNPWAKLVAPVFRTQTSVPFLERTVPAAWLPMLDQSP